MPVMSMCDLLHIIFDIEKHKILKIAGLLFTLDISGSRVEIWRMLVKRALVDIALFASRLVFTEIACMSNPMDIEKMIKLPEIMMMHDSERKDGNLA